MIPGDPQVGASVPLAGGPRRWLTQWGPLVVWLGAIALALVLRDRIRTGADVVGFLAQQTVTISSQDARQVATIQVEMHEIVERGEMLVALDDTEERQQLAMINAEMAQIQADLDAERARLKIELHRNEAEWSDVERAFLIDRADAHIAFLEQIAQNAADAMRVRGDRFELSQLEELYADGRASFRELNAIETDVNSVNARLQQNEVVLATKRSEFEAADQRWRAFLDSKQASWHYDAVLTPIKLAMEVKEKELAQIAYQIERLVLRAPCDGQVTAVFTDAGVNVQPGEPLLHLTTTSSDRIIAYLPEHHSLRLTEGLKVTLDRVAMPGTSLNGSVLSLAAAISEYPIRHRAVPERPEWGRAVEIRIEGEFKLLPGEQFRIHFTN